MQNKTKILSIVSIIFAFLMLTGGQQVTGQTLAEIKKLRDEGNYSLAISQSLSALHKDQSNMEVLYELAKSYRDANKYQEAVQYFEQYSQKAQTKTKKMSSELNRAICYTELKQIDKSRDVFEELAKDEPIMTVDQKGMYYSNFAVVYDLLASKSNTEQKKEYRQKALSLHRKDLAICTDAIDRRRIEFNIHRLNALLSGNKEDALSLLSKIERYIQFLKQKKTDNHRYYLMAAVNAQYEIVSEFDGSSLVQKYHDQVMNTKDSLDRIVDGEHVRNAEAQFKTKEMEQKKDQYAYGAIILVCVLILVVVFLIQQSKTNKKLKKSKKTIEMQSFDLSETNKKLRSKEKINDDATRYAAKVQQTMLPPDSLLQELFHEYFVIYLPKNGVSGDFYWAGINQQGSIYVAGADATGHGPAAGLLTVIGLQSLNDSLKNNADPDEMLEILDGKIKKLLHQEQSENMDGIDLAIVKLEQGGIKISCAKRPVYYFDNNKQKIIKYDTGGKGTGSFMFMNRSPYISVELPRISGDIIYISSDGFVDQQNSKGRKFQENKLIELLQTMSVKSTPLSEQKNTLLETLSKHKGDEHQRDDIMIIGVKIK